MSKIIIFVFVFISLWALIPFAYADNHMTILAVTETPNGYQGSAADLYLEIKPGTGKVFIETFPLSKLDTQISMRFAKDIACNFLEMDCNNYDFFYTIRADSPIVGGPSAGAASTILTISALKNFELDDRIAITGTINSGGLIGPVGDIKEKIDAAAEKKMEKVLIASGSAMTTTNNGTTNNGTTNNGTINLINYGKSKGIEVIEVFDLNTAVYYFSGKKFEDDNKELVIDKKYVEIMKGLAIMLCNRSDNFKTTIEKYDFNQYNIKNMSEVNEEKEAAMNLTKEAESFFADGNYYSAASFCYGANVKYRYLSLLTENLGKPQIIRKSMKLGEEINNFSEQVDNRKIETLTDLQTYIIVKERLIDSEDYAERVKQETNESDRAIADLAYAIERLYSAYSWSSFFGKGTQEFELDKESLRNSCIEKISEAQERYNYVMLYFPIGIGLENTKKGIENANKDLLDGNYELCLFKASKAKAEADLVLNSIGIEKDQVGNLIDKKLELVKRVIIKQTEKGAFPILGYSYYEYANTLKKNEMYSAMLYSEYALELSNLDIYFKGKEDKYAARYAAYLNVFHRNKGILLVFAGGFMFGLVIALIVTKYIERDYKTLGIFRRRLPGKKR